MSNYFTLNSVEASMDDPRTEPDEIFEYERCADCGRIDCGCDAEFEAKREREWDEANC